MKAAIINEKNAEQWASVFTMLEVINGLKSIDEFYNNVAPTWGVSEIYSRLHGWRKEVYKRFLMSGDFVIETFGDGSPTYVEYWGYGRYNPNAEEINTMIRRYPDHCYDWEAYKEKEVSLTWEEVCELYSF